MVTRRTVLGGAVGVAAAAATPLFACDDVAEFASFHQESAPTEFVVRLTPFGTRV